MASKKSKKVKGKVLDIKEFLGDTPVVLPVKSWAEDEEDYGVGHSSRARLPVVLPSASRASRGGVYDDDSAPHAPPYMAYLTNLPYEVEDSSIAELFPDLKVISLRLPRETDGKSKGFGYVEFQDREGLVAAINAHDLQLGGRRIRIDVAEAGDRKYGGRRGDRDRDREYDPERTAGDWRAGPRAEPEGGARRGEGGSFRREERDDAGASWREASRREEPPSDRPYGGRDSYDRGFGRDRDRDGGFGRDRDGDRSFSRDGDRSFSRDGDRSFGRDGDRNFGRDGDRSFGRDGDRSFGRDGDRSFGRDRDGDRGFGRDRDGDRGFGGDRSYGRDRDRGFGRDGGDRDFGDRGFGRDRRDAGFGSRGADRFGDREERVDAAPATRPKLNLLPRTVPLDQSPAVDAESGPRRTGDEEPPRDERESVASSRDSDGKSSPERRPAKKPPAASIFGAAKPVDTSAREREIEERLMKKAEEMRLHDSKTKDRDDKWRDKRDDLPKRTDDRGSRPTFRTSRDTRDGERDFRDRESRGPKDRPENRDSRDRGDFGSREKRNSRDSQDSQDRRDTKNSRDNSRDDRDSRPAREHGGEKDGATREGRRERNEERPMPKAKEHEPPNFIARNKFSYLENEDDDEDREASD